MNLPPRPPPPTVQIINPGVSVPSTAYNTPISGPGSARSKISSHRSRRPISRCEFDPVALREEWLRNAILYDDSRAPTEYSYVIGRPHVEKEHRLPKAAISIDIPSPLASRLFGHPGDLTREELWAEILAARSQWYNYNQPPPHPQIIPYQPASLLDSLETTCVFIILFLSTIFVFAMLTFIYLKGFVKF